MSKQPICIHVENEELSRIVQELAFRFGWVWGGWGGQDLSKFHKGLLEAYPTKSLFHTPLEQVDPNSQHLSASTQMGEIVKWFSEPEKVEWTQEGTVFVLTSEGIKIGQSSMNVRLSNVSLDRIQSEREKLK